jgi:hypothetical protein
VTNKNKRQRPPSGYRTPRQIDAAPAPPPRRRGLISGMLAPRPAVDTDIPKLSASVARGFMTAVGTPLVVVTAVAVVSVLWLVSVALGYQGPFSVFINAMAIPPVGTSFDFALAQGIFGAQAGLFAVLGLLAIRGLVVAVVTAMLVDVLLGRGASRWSTIRGLRAVPAVLAASVASLGIIIVALFVGPLLGAGFGALVQIGGVVVGVYLFGFAPTIAVAEGRGVVDTLSRSVRAARIPGTGSLTFAAVYVLISVVLPVVLLLAPGKPGTLIGVNPSIAAWSIVLVISLLQVAIMAALSFRYLSIADEVPSPPARPAPRTRR